MLLCAPPLRANSFPKVNASKAKIASLHTAIPTLLTQEETHPMVRPDRGRETFCRSKVKGKTKSKRDNAFVAKALLGIAGTTQISIGQSILIFASVTSICDDRTVSTMVEDYRSEDSVFS